MPFFSLLAVVVRVYGASSTQYIRIEKKVSNTNIFIIKRKCASRFRVIIIILSTGASTNIKRKRRIKKKERRTKYEQLNAGKKNSSICTSRSVDKFCYDYGICTDTHWAFLATVNVGGTRNCVRCETFFIFLSFSKMMLEEKKRIKKQKTKENMIWTNEAKEQLERKQYFCFACCHQLCVLIIVDDCWCTAFRMHLRISPRQFDKLPLLQIDFQRFYCFSANQIEMARNEEDCARTKSFFSSNIFPTK